MRQSTWSRRLACIFLVAGTIGGMALAAGTQGSQSDPLVTLSYLNEVATPEILRQVDSRVDKRLREIGVQGTGGSSAFVSTEVPAGKVLTLSAGTQFVVRSGTLYTEAALTDLTSGAAWSGNLALNHLYLAPGEGQQVSASSGASVMVLGGYSIN